MRALCFMTVALATLSGAHASDIISDIMTSKHDEERALQIKVEHFWKTLLESARSLQVEEHAQLIADAEKVIAELPPENENVRDKLREAVGHIRHASDTLLQQAASTAQLAADRLQAPGHTKWAGTSILTASGGVFSRAIQRFVGEGTYSERLLNHVHDRQADILPTLRGLSAVTGSVLKDCRRAYQLGSDVLKLNLYFRGTPKTPESAKDIANRITEVSGSLRHRFMSHVLHTVEDVADDYRGKNDAAAATVVRSSLRQMEEPLGTPRHGGAWLVSVV